MYCLYSGICIIQLGSAMAGTSHRLEYPDDAIDQSLVQVLTGLRTFSSNLQHWSLLKLEGISPSGSPI